MSFRKHLTVGLVAGFASQGLGALVSILVIRKLGPLERGIYAMVLALNTTLTYCLDLGISAANETFLGKAEWSLGAVNGISLASSGLFGGSAIVAGWIFRGELVNRIMPGVSPAEIALGLALVPFTLYSLYGESMLVGIEAIVLLNKISFLQSLLLMIGSAIFVILLNGGVKALLIVWAGAYVISALLVFLVLVRRDRPAFHLALWRKALSFGVRSFVTRAFRLGAFRLDSFFLNSMSGTIAVGYYSIATGLTEKLAPVLRAVYNAANRRVTGLDRCSSVAFTARIIRGFALVLAVWVLAIGVAASFAVRLLFGGAFLPAASPLRILALGIGFYSLAQIFGLFFTNQMARPGFVSLVIGLCVAASIPAYVLVIPRWGITGAAWVTCGSTAALFAILVAAFSRESGLALREVLVIRRGEGGRYARGPKHECQDFRTHSYQERSGEPSRLP